MYSIIPLFGCRYKSTLSELMFLYCNLTIKNISYLILSYLMCWTVRLSIMVTIDISLVEVLHPQPLCWTGRLPNNGHHWHVMVEVLHHCLHHSILDAGQIAHTCAWWSDLIRSYNTAKNCSREQHSRFQLPIHYWYLSGQPIHYWYLSGQLIYYCTLLVLVWTTNPLLYITGTCLDNQSITGTCLDNQSITDTCLENQSITGNCLDNQSITGTCLAINPLLVLVWKTNPLLCITGTSLENQPITVHYWYLSGQPIH